MRSCSAYPPKLCSALDNGMLYIYTKKFGDLSCCAEDTYH
jgi:hypothetical protein